MSGKRLLDAARLFNAGRAIAQQHFVLRREQWNLLTKTSGVAKAVKSQTDRVTVTAKAAVELAKRFNETGPAWQQGQPNGVAENVRDAAGNAASRARDAVSDVTKHTSVRSAGQPATTDDDGTLASLRKREQQRQAERQIPSASADEQPVRSAGSGQDTFNERSRSTTHELSSLPRAKLPKHTDDPPATTQALPSQSLNQDVYPAPANDAEAQKSEDQSPEGINTDIFASPRISRMLGQTNPEFQNPYAARKKLPPQPLPEMLEASERWKKENVASPELPSAIGGQAASSTKQQAETHDAETQDLAASIAKDAEELQTNAPTETAPYEMRESRVPSSRFGRIWQYSGLATSMAFGAVGESFRRLAGGSGQGSLMLSEANLNRLVAKLSRMRGAALKLGQMISFQDSKVLPPTINAVLQRVQDSADYMPASQRDKVLVRNLGADWRELFSSFEEKPFAAASIGQVHRATLKANGKDVAVKVQYPGVKNSIDSDLNNLSLLLTASRLLPRGMYLDKTIANARTELGWECDYEREAAAQIRFKEEFLVDELDTFAIPIVFSEASGPDILTAEFMHGTAVAKIPDLTQQERDWIGTQILRLCLRELMEWRFMQTDPNWTNFLYNRRTKKIELLDFGASRDFPDEFVEPYVSLLIAASKGDRDACRRLSIELGYLTGQESSEMLAAHVDSILTLAEPFVESAPEVYDFEDQTITDRVRANIGLMLRERLAPPPEETYSLHRKLSGAFLLCARLRSKVPARDMFAKAVKVWDGREDKVKI